jgi:hypothetical protein
MYTAQDLMQSFVLHYKSECDDKIIQDALLLMDFLN